MSIPFLKASRCVLLIGDESLAVYNVTGRGAKLVDSVPWQAEDFPDVVASLIRRECGGKSILMLNDMTDQHFKGGQRLPKVGPLDRGNVLQRRLTVAFPNYAIRGALPMKEGKGKGASAAGSLYLFSAVPNSDAINKTIEAVRRSMASIAGFVLLPVEASDMVTELSRSISKGQEPSRWTVFIGQHQNGALRQVITRDGQLAMTRMTPLADTEGNVSAWADEVAQEFKATISYLSRFGYTAEDGTDVIVVAGEQAGAALEKRIGIPCNYASFTAQEAARELGISVGFQEDMRYADVLHVAWCGRKSKFILPMQAKDLQGIHKPRQAVAAMVVLLLLGAGYMSWMLLGQLNTIMTTNGELSEQRKILAGVQSAHETEVARMTSLGFDVNLIQGSINAYNAFNADSLDTLAYLQKIRKALGNDLRLDALRMTRVPAAKIDPSVGPQLDAQGNEIKPRPVLETSLELSFPPTLDPEIGVREVNNLEQRLKTEFPQFNVSIDKQVADMTFKESMTGQTGEGAEQQTEDYIAILSIKGALP